MRHFDLWPGEIKGVDPLVSPFCTDREWLDARRYRVGASELAAVLGCSPYASPFSLFWQKTNGWDVEQTFDMEMGHRLEPVAADIFAERYPDLSVCRPAHRAYAREGDAVFCASPDFLVAGPPDGYSAPPRPLEVKSDEGGSWGRTGTADIPVHHRWQIWTQCFVLGADIGYVVRLAGKRFSVHPVAFDAAARTAFAAAHDQARRFLNTLVTGIAPELDGHDATTTTLQELEPAVVEDQRVAVPPELLERLRRAQEEHRAAKAELDAVNNTLRWAMGRAEFAVDTEGRKVAKRLVTKVAGYSVPPHTQDRIYLYRSAK